MNFADKYFLLLDAQRALEIAKSAAQGLRDEPIVPVAVWNAVHRTVAFCASMVDQLQREIQRALAAEGAQASFGEGTALAPVVAR